ncbi:glycosyltransferase family 4 protein [Longimicrobium sp.]|jgi:glycosyltransferase involved in cell wall biosynthesis|uniref:glycosyltransferase family 4 protein n=1 Tax=Longimicrobium sp. TaxID=2029185 RepID=UPI002ED7EC5A
MPITVLALVDYYLPGYKAGGPLRTLANMVEQLAGSVRFRVVTRDRDCGDDQPYPGVPAGAWQEVGGAQVLYLAPGQLGPAGLRRALAGPYDVLYLNSLFSPRLTLAPLLLRRAGGIPRRPVVLAPRGELHPGAMGTGSWGRALPRAVDARFPSPRNLKKRGYIATARGLGLLDGVVWQASSEEERADILRHAGPGATVRVAPDLSAAPVPVASAGRAEKRAGELRAAFLSRIAPKKNLDGALRMLRGVRGRVRLDVYGPVEDGAYWDGCQALIAGLPPGVSVHHHGSVAHERVPAVLAESDVLLFPTHGENFGHVIVEAMVQGCPVLISDQTPWRGLEARRAGWDLPLDGPEAFTRALQRLADMDAQEHGGWRAGAAEFGRQRSVDPGAVAANRALFEYASSLGARR